MENPRTACELVHGRLHTRFLTTAPSGSQASVQYRDSSLLIFRPAHRVNPHRFQPAAYRSDFLLSFFPSRSCEPAPACSQSPLIRPGCPVLMQDRHRIPARRLQITDIRHFSADFVEVLQGQLNLRLVGNRHQMEGPYWSTPPWPSRR